MKRRIAESLLASFYGLFEGLHVSSFVLASVLMPAEAVALFVGAIVVKLLNFAVEAGLLKLRNFEVRKRLNQVNHMISFGLAVLLSLVDFHGSKIELRPVEEFVPLFIIIGCAFAMADFALHALANIVASYSKRRVVVPVAAPDGGDPWFKVKAFAAIVVFILTVVTFSYFVF